MFQKIAQCHIEMQWLGNIFLKYEVVKSKFLKPSIELAKRNVTQVIAGHGRTHYVVQLESSSQKNWYQVNEFCKDALDAGPFRYSSLRELMEIEQRAKGIGGSIRMLFTALHTSVKVR